MKIRTLGILLMIGITFVLTGCGGGGGASAPTQTQAEIDAAKLATLKKIEGNWTFSYNPDFSLTDNLTLSNVKKLGPAPLDYEVTITPSDPLAPILGAYSTSEDTWTIVGEGLSGSNSTYTGGFVFKTDGNVVLPGGCFYRTNKTTNVKSACYPLTGTKTSFASPTSTKATLTLGIPSLPANTLVSGIQFTIQLPNGVSPEVVVGNDATGSTTLTGGATGSFGGAGYNAVNNTITFGNITLNSFGAGNFLLVNCKIAQGSTVASNGFTISNVQLLDANGAQIPNANISIAAQFL